MSKISVIVPVYNVEKYLEKCLNSIINQTYKDLEIICIDDGSTDGSLKILEEYAKKDSRIKVIKRENHGLSYTRNQALNIAVGEFCYFVDSDDWMENNALEICYNLIKNNDVDAVVHSAESIADGKKALEMTENSRSWFDFFSKPDGIYEVPINISKDLASVVWNKLYKTEIIHKYNCRFPEGLVHEDEVFLWDYFIHCKNYYYTDKKLYNYVRHSDSIMGQINKTSRILDILKVQNLRYNIVKKYKNIDDYASLLTDIYIDCVYMVLEKSKNKYKKQICSLIRAYQQINNDERLAQLYKDIRYFNFKRFIQNIFSIKNSWDRKYKTITILGFKFLVKRKLAD